MLRGTSRSSWLQTPLAACLFALASLLLPSVPFGAPAPKPEPPKTVTIDFGAVKMEFVLVPKGTFLMGSPKTEKGRNPFEEDFDAEAQHEVAITKPFFLAKYPMTQEQYVAITGKKNPSWFCKDFTGADKVKGLHTGQFPVECVSWQEAKSCCEAMTKRDQQKRTFRLPTEAEWEYACRAGTKTVYFFGDDPKKLGDFAYFVDNSGDRTHRVGEKNQPNPWGLHDMLGNVQQWCEDYYGPYEGLTREDPLQAKKQKQEYHVLRGGSWGGAATWCRPACRFGTAPDAHSGNAGFRVAFGAD